MTQEDTKISATMIDSQELHPCGLTMERMYWPFKMPWEKAMIQRWKERMTGNEFDDDPTNPF